MTAFGVVLVISITVWFFGFFAFACWNIAEYVEAKNRYGRDPEEVKKFANRVLTSPLWPFIALLWLIELVKDAR